MLPARFVVLTQLPLTQSGKVDKRTLQQMPAPQETARDPAAETPADGIEASLLKVFRDVLRSPSFGFDDSFFDHGGYSLLAVKLFARIANTLGTELPITALFDAPTVRSLATLLREGTSLATIVPVVPRRAGGDEPPFFLVQSYLLYGLAGSMVPETRPVLGIREAESFNSVGVPLAERVTTCADAIQRIYPRGLVHLGGWCAAATLTIEIARRLQEQGRTIGMLALFDAEAPGFVPRPASGNPRLARLRATLKYHASRLRRLGWAGRFEYLLERATQQTMQCVEWIYMRHRGAVGRLQHALPFLPNAFFYNRWTQLRAEEHPGLQPIDAKVYLFRASDVVHVPGSDEAMGWREIARGGAEVIFVPGHHESMFHEPQLSTLREEFRQAMLKVEPASPFPNNGSSGQRERAS
jgi:thioesterase domain-containing protein